ncbi:hypothetical protein L1887_01785 [Cichorium endivia]|nr:hypothetical protein L1887_01785 [Cichorium endivia]
MWLSSSRASSPSSCLQDNSLSGCMDLKIDALFISLLSTPSIKSREIISTKVAFFDGPIANPIEEASLVLDQRIVSDQDLVFHENLEEKEVVSWLATSIENEFFFDCCLIFPLQESISPSILI